MGPFSRMGSAIPKENPAEELRTSTYSSSPPSLALSPVPHPVTKMGLIEAKTAEETLRDQEEEESIIDLENEKDKIALTSLSSYIQSCWNAARDAKIHITERLLDCLRRRNGEYDPEKLADIEMTGGCTIFMTLTDEKCNAAEAWLQDILMPPGDKPWKTSPTPIPTISPEDEESIVGRVAMESMLRLRMGEAVTVDEVKERAEEIRKEVLDRVVNEAKEMSDGAEIAIEDKLVEGGFYSALEDVISDIVTYPSGILKGPIFRKKTKNSWKKGSDGKFRPVPSEVLVEEYERKSPFDIFPGPSSCDVNDGDLIDINWLTEHNLVSLKKVEGYDIEAINKVLEMDHSVIDEYMYPSFQQKSILEDRPREYDDPNGKIPAIQFWGKIRGSILIEHGFDSKKIDEESMYECEVWQIGPYTIRASLNDDPFLRRPYSKTSFRRKVGSFWGRSVPEIIKDSQDVCNSSARAIVNNLSIASGPQAVVDISQIPPGESISDMYPWKIWQVNGEKAINGRDAIKFFQPGSNIQELILVYRHFSEEADNKSGIPKYVYGSGGSSGALSTATGMTVMMNNAAKGLKKVVFNIDRDIIVTTVTRQYDSLMAYGEDESIKGDINIVATGSTSLIVKEQRQIRLNEALKTTSNPVDMGLMGPKARLTILRMIFKDLLGTRLDEIFPDPDQAQFSLPPGSQSPEMQMLSGQGSSMAAPPGSVPQPGGPQYGGGPENNGMSSSISQGIR